MLIYICYIDCRYVAVCQFIPSVCVGVGTYLVETSLQDYTASHHTMLYSVTILTLRSLTLYIYMEHLFLMFLDHTQRRSTVGRTPLDE